MNRLNTGDTGQAVTSSNDGLLYSGFIGDGMYVLSSGSEFEVEVQSNNLIRMADGSALMQGRHIEIPASDSEYITINNGSQGMNRKDLVVFRYTKDVTGVESVNVVVIEGEETSGTAQVPDYIEGDILTGATLADMPLYVVELQGINITAVTPQFETIGSHKNAVDKIAEHTAAIANLNSNLSIYLGDTENSMLAAIRASNYTKPHFFTCDASLTKILTKNNDSSSGKGMYVVLGDPTTTGTSIDILLYTGNQTLFTARYNVGSGVTYARMFSNTVL